jgi:hypothetical protein
MKKLLSLALFLISLGAYSQIALPVTWDAGGPDFTTTSFGGAVNSTPTVVDPTDPTNTVLRLTKPAGAQTWAGTTIGKDFAPKINDGGFPVNIPFAVGNTSITVRVRSTRPAGSTMMVKIEDKFNGGINVEKAIVTTVAAGQWENMVFNMAAPTLGTFNLANNYGKLSFFPNFGSAGDNTNEYWVDNIGFGLPPVISSFAPTSQSPAGTVVITGSNFTGATAVSFGGVAAASFTVDNDNQITATVGIGSSGAVKVTTPVSFTTLAGFTYLAPLSAPTITSFSPTSGATGASIVITGTNFTTATAVNFGGDAAASFVINSSTQITAIVDAGNSGSVAVTNPDGFATRPGFTYIPPTPTISSFTPTSSGGGVTVTITGTNFLDVNAVTFGGTPAASFVVVSTTSITAVVAAGTSGSVAVTNSGGTGTRAGFIFKAPISLPIDFQSSTVDYSVTSFSANPANITTALATDPTNPTNTALRISKLAGASTWAGTTLGKDFAPKVNNGGLASPIPFTATDRIITARVYSPYPVGTVIMCKVENAANGGINQEVRSNTTVANGWNTMFWNFNAINTANTYEKISFFMDEGNGGSASSIFYLDDVAFYPSPVISSFAPTSATTGGSVVITGTNFTGATAVSFGGVAATSFVVNSNTQITAVVANGASGSVSVTRGGTGTLAGFIFTAPPTGATVISFTPLTAGETGVVTITGTNFNTVNSSNPAAVRFGGTNALSFVVDNDNQITAVVGAGASGSVSVTNPDGIGALAGFTYIAKVPISMPINWDSPFTVDYSTDPFGGANMTSATDVDPSNPLNRVLRVVKGTGTETWAGTTFGKAGVNNGGFATALPFTSANRFVTVKFYSTRPVGTVVMLKTEQGTAPAQNTETQALTTVQNAWETLVFDFGNRTGGNPLNFSGVNYDKLSIFPNFGTAGAASANTYYVDDVRFVPGPNILSFAPTSAATGTTVVITGDNFTGATAVSFGGVAATSFVVDNDNQISAVVGVGFSGNVSVTTLGVSTLAGFDWIAPPGAPTISSFTPTASFAGNVVRINGSNFTGATAVKFGGTDAASYTVVNSSRIDAVVGAGSTGNVTVTNGFGIGSRPGFTFNLRSISLPVTWDDFATVNLNSSSFAQVTSVIATDPLDVSNTVLRMTKAGGGAGVSGTFLGSADLTNRIPFTIGNTTISMRFYSPVVGLPVRLNLRGPAPINKTVNTTVIGWQILEFDFASEANISDPYNGLELYPGYGQVPGVAQVSYVDNIILGRFPTNVWRGTTSTDFLKGSNWSLGFAPLDCNMDVQVNAGTPFSAILATGSYGAGNVNIQNGTTLVINSGATYSVCGNITNGNVSGAGTLVLNGTSTQNIAGSHTVDNVTVTKPAASGVVTINGTISTKGVVTLSNANSSIVVGGSGKLILASDASATGSIAAIPVGASVSGNVTQQRYFSGTGDAWYLVGTPIQGGNFSQWTDNMYMAVGTNLGGNQGVFNLGIQHSTVLTYDDAFHNVSPDTAQKTGWRVPVLGDLLTPGKGYRVWLNSYLAPTRSFDNVGTITTGPFSFPTLNRTEPVTCQPNTVPATEPCDEDYRGWNFLANPFPSAIDWDNSTPGVWTKPGTMLNGFWRWNKSGYGVYFGGSYAGTGPAPTNPNLIASGQGFFVKLSTPGAYTATLSITENAKASGANSFLRTATSTANTLRMTLEKDGLVDYNFMNIVRFADDATDGKDLQMDIPNLAGSGFNFTMPVGTEEMVINSLAPLTANKTVPMNSKFNGSYGFHRFVMSGLETFAGNVVVYLKDNWTGTMENISANPVYTFEVTPANISLINRFELLFTPDGLTSSKANLNGVTVSLYPNPATSRQVTLSVNGNVQGAAQVVITDLLGKVVMKSDMNLADGKNQKQLDINLASGVYTVKITTATKSVSQKLIVR